MEEETDEVIKRYDNSLSFWHILGAVVVVIVVALFGYWYLPAVVNFLQVVIDWFNWFILVLSYLVVVNALIFLIYVSFSFWKTTGKSKPELYDQHLAAEPPVVSALSCDYFGLSEFGNYGNNNSKYKDIVPAFQAVRAVEESNCTYDRVVAEVNLKSYRRTRSEKKAETARTKVEYRRMESERVTRMQTMNGLSSEEFRMTVETFITEKRKTLLRENGVVEQWQNCLPQWQTGLPQLQNGDVQWQRSRDDGTGRRRHRSRNHRLVGGSGSTGSGSYLAISN